MHIKFGVVFRCHYALVQSKVVPVHKHQYRKLHHIKHHLHVHISTATRGTAE